jgi:hypothetical protein
MELQKKTRTAAADSTVSSRRMAAFTARARWWFATAQHHVMSDRIEGGSLLLPPDTDADVVIELKPVRAVFLSSDEDVRLLPVVIRSAKRA